MNDDQSKRRFFAGNSLRQALVLAAGHFDIPPEEVAYTPVEKRHGFLKTRRRVVIEVDPDNPRRPAGAAPIAADSPGGQGAIAAPRHARGERPERRERGEGGERRPFGRGPEALRPERPERPERRGRGGRAPSADAPQGGWPRGNRAEVVTSEREQEGLITLPEAPRRPSERYPVATGPVAEAAERGLRQLLSVAGLELAFNIHQGEGRLEIELSGDDAELCSGEEGELLRAIEHLLPRLVRTLAGEPIPCRVDCDNFHEIREERLRSLAQRVADEVRRRGRARTLEPMNPADRRIIHVTLADDPAVETESEGDGFFKRVTIRPT